MRSEFFILANGSETQRSSATLSGTTGRQKGKGASRWRRRMQEIVLVVVLRFHVLQITFEFALDALEGVVDALDVATQVVRDFLIAFPVQIRRQHFLF